MTDTLATPSARRPAQLAGALRELAPVRWLRGFRELGRFARMLAPVLRRSEAVVTPDHIARYASEFLNSLVLPYPPPNPRFENAFPGEADAIRRMSLLTIRTVLTNYYDGRSLDPAIKARRDQHAKAHGCVHGEFIVREDLPDEFAVGIFQQKARQYRAIVRFSNARPTPQSDKKWDGRGMAIKLVDLTQPTALSGLASGLAPHWEQDFVLGSFPVFFCRDIVDYQKFMDAVVAPTGSWRERFVWLAKWFIFTVGHPRQMLLFLRIAMNKIDNPLRATYHSMAPYLFGDDKVVRYIVSPVGAANKPPPARGRSQTADFLRDALAAGLDPVGHPGDKVVFDFSIQVRGAAGAADVENAMRWWKRRFDEIVRLGRIEIPVQNFQASDDLCACENRTFNPWNSLSEHRPVGSLNRMRLAVYLASLQVRHRLNMIG